MHPARTVRAGLHFCNTLPYKRLQCVLCRLCKLYRQPCKTVHRALQGLFLRLCPLSRPRYQTDTTSHCTACDTLERLPAPGRFAQIPDTSATPGRCTGQCSRPIIIMYIRGQGCALLWIHTRRCSISQIIPARRGQLLPSVNCWQVLTHYQQHRPGAPAEGSASPPVQGQPGTFHPA